MSVDIVMALIDKIYDKSDFFLLLLLILFSSLAQIESILSMKVEKASIRWLCWLPTSCSSSSCLSLLCLKRRYFRQHKLQQSSQKITDTSSASASKVLTECFPSEFPPPCQWTCLPGQEGKRCYTTALLCAALDLSQSWCLWLWKQPLKGSLPRNVLDLKHISAFLNLV